MNTLQDNVFQRVEKKYLISEETRCQFLKQAEPFIEQDKYGVYSICNIYFDTVNFDLVRNSIEKPKYKEKLRLRSYGIPKPGDTVFLEIKKKWKGIVSKRRISLTLNEAENYLKYGVKPECSNQILNEIDYFIRFYHPERKLFLAYDRAAYTGKQDGSVRITFDHNIRSRSCDLDLEKGDYGAPLMDGSSCLLELKVPVSIPVWLARILSDLSIFPVSFSKYGAVYKNNIIEKGPESLYLQTRFNNKEGEELCLQTY